MKHVATKGIVLDENAVKVMLKRFLRERKVGLKMGILAMHSIMRDEIVRANEVDPKAPA